MMNNHVIHLSSIEAIFNSWNRYLLLSETAENLGYRCASLSETIEVLAYMRARVGAYCIRLSIIPNKNRQSFGDSWSMQSSLSGCLWGVCKTPLPRYVHLIDGWYRCAYVGAYCIRPSIISNENRQSFGDSWDIHSSLTECL